MQKALARGRRISVKGENAWILVKYAMGVSGLHSDQFGSWLRADTPIMRKSFGKFGRLEEPKWKERKDYNMECRSVDSREVGSKEGMKKVVAEVEVQSNERGCSGGRGFRNYEEDGDFHGEDKEIDSFLNFESRIHMGEY